VPGKTLKLHALKHLPERRNSSFRPVIASSYRTGICSESLKAELFRGVHRHYLQYSFHLKLKQATDGITLHILSLSYQPIIPPASAKDLPVKFLGSSPTEGSV